MKMQKLIIEDCLQLVEFFKTLGDFTRLRIVLELKTKRCVGELAEELEMSHSAVSHQLNILKARGKQRADTLNHKTRALHFTKSVALATKTSRTNHKNGTGIR